MAKLVQCRSCGNHLARNAKSCPHCGAKGPGNTGCLATVAGTILGLIILGVIISVAIDDETSSSTQSTNQTIEMLKTTADISALSPTGELAAMFNFMSDHTDLQRDAKLKEIKGQVVQWRLPVFEVDKMGSGYLIQTDSTDRYVGCSVILTPLTDEDRQNILNLKTGSFVSIRGVLTGDTTMRHLEIEPAILWQQ